MLCSVGPPLFFDETREGFSLESLHNLSVQLDPFAGEVSVLFPAILYDRFHRWDPSLSFYVLTRHVKAHSVETLPNLNVCIQTNSQEKCESVLVISWKLSTAWECDGSADKHRC